MLKQEQEMREVHNSTVCIDGSHFRVEVGVLSNDVSFRVLPTHSVVLATQLSEILDVVSSQPSKLTFTFIAMLTPRKEGERERVRRGGESE